MTENCIFQGDARHLPLADDSMDCIVTSPPYWGQRDYKGQYLIWESGVRSRESGEKCRHRWAARVRYTERSAGSSTAEAFSKPGKANVRRLKAARWRRDATCCKCGAWRGQLGLEPSPELYIQHLVEIFRECRRVLKPTGTCWLVISDSRPSGNRKNHGTRIGHKQESDAGCLSTLNSRPLTPDSLKPSDMLGLPHDLVKALRADGWYWRDEIIWAKPNGFCESVRTRVTRNHEYVFLLTKSPSPKYFFDFEAIMEPCAPNLKGRTRPGSRVTPYAHSGRGNQKKAHSGLDFPRASGTRLDREGANSRMQQDRDVYHPAARKLKRRVRAGYVYAPPGGRSHSGGNLGWETLYRRKRSVWFVAVSKPRGLKHYATFPEKLIEPMILAGCPKGGIVLDCFAGSGTVGVVARRLGRRFILLDLKYQNLQRQRLETVDGQL